MSEIPGFEGIYACDIYGNIFSLNRVILKTNKRNRKKFEWKLPLIKLSPYCRQDGYLQVNLRKNGKAFSILVHRLIAKTFLNCLNQEVNHIDGNKSNNALINLEISSRSANIKHAFATGLKSHKGKNHPRYFIDESLQEKIVDLLKGGISQQKIADSFNISQSSVSSIKNKLEHRETIQNMA